jgi:hypothetical protein
MTKNWRTWELKDWNDALLQAIALGGDGAGRRVVRIESSARYLAQITGDPDCQAEDAKKAFISAFGDSERSIKKQFTNFFPDSLVGDLNKAPEVVAALYLSLLAASADNETADEGNFRQRFAEITGIPAAANWSFSSLPSMWEHFARWMRERAKNIGDCATSIRAATARAWCGNNRRSAATPTVVSS